MLQQPSKHHKYVSSNECRTESSPRINNSTTNIFLSALDVWPSPQDPHSSRSTRSAAARDPSVRARGIGGAEAEERDSREERARKRSRGRRTDSERNSV